MPTPTPAWRWPLAAALATLLHAALLWPLAQSPLDASQDSPGRGQGAGDAARRLELRLAVAPAAAPSGATAAARAESVAAQAPQDAGGGGDDAERYFERLRAHLQRYRRPPLVEDAVRGTALVGFRVDGRGDVSQLRLERSAGHATLDAEALALVVRAAPLPPPPRRRALRLSVPVVFE